MVDWLARVLRLFAVSMVDLPFGPNLRASSADLESVWKRILPEISRLIRSVQARFKAFISALKEEA